MCTHILKWKQNAQLQKLPHSFLLQYIKNIYEISPSKKETLSFNFKNQIVSCVIKYFLS